MTNVEVSDKAIELQFTNAVDYFGLYIPNLLSFYALFTKRVNNGIDAIRICVKTDVTPVLEYNESWVCGCDRAVFVFILSIEMYRFILHHCTHRELTGANAFKASTATCNSKELQIFLASAPEELAKYVRESVWSKKTIEEEINQKIAENDYYYESVFQLLNQHQEQQQQQQQQDQDQQNGQGQQQQQQSSSRDDEGDQDDQDQDNETSSGSQGDEDSDSESDQDQDGSEGQDSEDQDGQEGQDGSSQSQSGGTGEDGSDREGTESSQDGSETSSESGDAGDSDGNQGSAKGRATGRNSGDAGQDGKGKSKKQNPKKDAFDEWNKNGEQNTEEWGANNIVDEMIRDVIENKCTVTGWGKLSGEAVEEIMLKNKRKVNITPIIAGFGATVRCRKRVSTRLRVNKRYEYLPGYRTDRKTKMLFAIDSSGSMSESDIRKGCEILHNFYKKTEIDLAFWDAKMVKPQKLKKNFQKITAPGRGGTDPHCIGEYLKAHNMHYDGVVIFTDCYWEWTENNLGSHIFVISSEKEYTVPKFVKHHASIQQLTHVFDD